MYCEKCGKPLEEGMDFCPECGNKVSKPEIVALDEVSEVTVENAVASGTIIETSKIKYCHNCGAANTETDVFCYACGKPMNDNGGTGKKTEKKSGKKIVLGIVAAIAILLVAIVIGFTTHSGKKNALIYLKDNELSYYAKKDAVEFSDDVYEDKDDIYGPSNRMTNYVTVSKDGKYVFYPQNYSGGEFDLYCRRMNDTKAADDRVASGISEYTVLQNNKVVYMENSGSKKMYISDLKNKEKVASDVLWYFVSEDEKYILWKTGSDNRLYVCDLALKNDKIKIDSDISSMVYVSDDLKQIVYTKDEALYYVENFGEKEKIDSDVNSPYVVQSNTQTEIYYLVDENESIEGMDLVDDDYATQDANMQEPDISYYQKTVTKPSFWGPREEVVTDDAYYAEMDKYNEKLTRDRIREYVNEEISLRMSTMYRYKLGEAEAEEYTTGNIFMNSSQKSVLIYFEIDLEKGKKIKLSQIMDMDDYSEMEGSIRKAIASESLITYMVSNGKRVALNIDTDEYDPVVYTRVHVCATDENNKECYLEIAENNDEHKIDLFRTSYGKMDGELELVSDEYFDIELVSDQGVYYTTESDDGYVGELYLNDNKIDSDVMSGSVISLGNGKGVVYLTDPDDTYREGTLRMNTGSDSVKISDDVAYYVSNDNGDIAFLEDYNYDKYRGDLKVFRNNKATLIDSDVTAIIYY